MILHNKLKVDKKYDKFVQICIEILEKILYIKNLINIYG